MNEKIFEKNVQLPVCPYCKAEMEPVHFIGYYDEFYHWLCDCEKLPNARKDRGGYA